MNNSPLRYIADIVIETKTPLKIGNGSLHLTIDSPIARDASGLPSIPGTAIAGVLRHAFKENNIDQEEIDTIFGFQKDSDGSASRLSISSARVIDGGGTAVIELRPLSEWDDYLRALAKTPVRDHVRINNQGTADTKNNGKFDEEILFRGVRFVFSIELAAAVDEEDTGVNT